MNLSNFLGYLQARSRKWTKVLHDSTTPPHAAMLLKLEKKLVVLLKRNFFTGRSLTKGRNPGTSVKMNPSQVKKPATFLKQAPQAFTRKNLIVRQKPTAL